MSVSSPAPVSAPPAASPEVLHDPAGHSESESDSHDGESEGLTDLTTDSEDSFGSDSSEERPELSQLDEEVAVTSTVEEVVEDPVALWGWIASTLFPESIVYGCLPQPKDSMRQRQRYSCCHDIPKLWAIFRRVASFLRFPDIVTLGSVSVVVKRDASYLVTSVYCHDVRPAQLSRLLHRFSLLHTLAFSHVRPDLKMAVLEVLPTCLTLTSLNASRNKLTVDDLEHLRGVWDPSKVQLTGLDMSHNPLHDACVQPLVRFLTPFTCLKSLGLADVGLGYFGMQRLAEAAVSQPGLFSNLTSLDVHDNNIIADGVVALADSLHVAPKLVSLNLNNCLMGVLGALRLSSALILCTNLQELRLSNNRLAPGGIGALAKALPMYQELRVLDISHNGIDAQSVAEGLAVILPECRRLQVLDISNNPLKRAGVLSLAGAVQRCVKLTMLKLGDAHGGSDGMLALVDMLTTVPRLRELGLQNNHGGPVAAQRLAGHVGSGCGKNITCLDLSGNGLGVDGLTALSLSLCHLPQLLSLSLASNEVDGRNAAMCHAMGAVIDAVSANLTHLDVSGNRLGEFGLSVLSSTVIHCRKIAVLNVSHCNMGAKVLQRVLDALTQLPLLSEVIMDGNHLGRAGIEKILAQLPQLSRFVTDVPFLNRGRD
jgi:Ran GTPase-activating protein (RanGAP) involved in mRNA processing and transport